MPIAVKFYKENNFYLKPFIMKKTLVLGASTNPQRVSFQAIHRLLNAGYHVVPLGIKEGKVAGIDIITDWPDTIDDLDTITLYLNPKRQEAYYKCILNLNPTRIIFNPGTENPVLSNLAREKGIETEIACTLVLLSLNDY